MLDAKYSDLSRSRNCETLQRIQPTNIDRMDCIQKMVTVTPDEDDNALIALENIKR